ncbi:growth factor receptor-bound protein 2-like [Haliotis rufescens]|uniref:growth factor receptor-bound protein 2-like n=1 Tax=Haliotis rufescens TaxID=6454 RepID=UPI001EB04CD3|nr:growth factor receptor-bound protein 2-like [Haliotis rufescens]
MEASAAYEFKATQPDELSFPKEATLKILNTEDPQWYKAEYEGHQGYIPSNYVHFDEPQWYKGKIPRSTAEEMLLSGGSQPDGAFVVRKSESDDNGHSLSVKYGNGVQHFKILQDQSSGKYHLWNMKFNSINKLVAHHRDKSVSRLDTQPKILLCDMSSGGGGIVCKCRAAYNFAPSDAEELSFQKGDVLNILEKVDDNWWRGELNGNEGLVPANYLKEM